MIVFNDTMMIIDDNDAINVIMRMELTFMILITKTHIEHQQ